MLLHRVYFSLKPFLPWRARIALRRLSVRRTLARFGRTWPVFDAARQPPPHWSGWPGGKQFALVLTHDVENPVGWSQCGNLARLEQVLGFRSSFNLIPEGPYRVTPQDREALTRDGFEIGVHDLKHDGKLFFSYPRFLTQADAINRYLEEWQACGFRGGFMLRNLVWLHELQIRYDSSTFDTDPFELQPEGAGTIFPFWISASPAKGVDGQATPALVETRSHPPRPPHGGFVELPYTLPQDSTLFLLLRQNSPELWKRKLDWIASHGGMALLNVHPDYIAFHGPPRRRQYPAAFYREFLEYVNERYRGAFWNPLPRELSRWYLGTPGAVNSTPHVMTPARPIVVHCRSDGVFGLQGKRAAVLLYSDYPSDTRPRRAAEALAGAGMEVEVFCLADSDTTPRQGEMLNGVRIFRCPLRHERQQMRSYVWRYTRFLLGSLRFLTRRSWRRRYDLVHVHNMPDVLVFPALLQKLRGTAILLDLHDPMPELMRSIYGLPDDDWRVRLLRLFERWSIGLSDLAVTPNKSFRDLFVSRSCAPGKMRLMMNTPEESIFVDDAVLEQAANREAPAGEFRIMHHGSILHRHGIDLLVEAMARVRAEIPAARLDIFGPPNAFLDVVLATASHCGVADIVRYHGAKSQSGIADAIRRCHVGVVPNRRTPFTEINFPTRIFEYLALNRPAIVPDTQGIRDYFGPGELTTFEPDDVADLAAKIIWVHRHPEETQARTQRGQAVYRRHLWHDEKQRFLRHVAALCCD